MDARNLLRSFILVCSIVLGITTHILAQPTGTAEQTRSASTFVAPALRPYTSGGYTYMSVNGDPFGVRQYMLRNGLMVYLSVNKAKPRIFTSIAARTGSANDPADATGLAHYLEHLLFKGTDKYGTKDYASERVIIEKIENMYEQYRVTTDAQRRKVMYATIDSLSQVAAGFAIANEYDKMLSFIGAQGTNAFTSNDVTAYINDIPSNHVRTWIDIEAERFRNPVLRLFHTELEAVYEEKNISLDDDGNQLYEKFNATLYKKHPYGQQTTIGTVEHLKNPSMKKIREYYRTYYVPNNMAIMMAGDFDPDAVIKHIDELFGKFESRPIPVKPQIIEAPLKGVETVSVTGPSPEQVQIGYRLPGKKHPDVAAITMADMMLANGRAGFIDINLTQAQKVQSVSAGPNFMNDYGTYTITLAPRQGQSLDDAVKLALAEIDKLKKGQFTDQLMQSVINDFVYRKLIESEENASRVFACQEAFIANIPWNEQVSEIDKLRTITREQIIDAANKYFGSDYVIAYKRNGKPSEITKVEKPSITPVPVNREDQSEFVKTILTKPSQPLTPNFINYATSITSTQLKHGVELLSYPNTENQRYSLYYMVDIGSYNDPLLSLGVNYLKFIGTSKRTATALKETLYSLGCNLGVNVSGNRVYVSMSGIDTTFVSGLQLLEEILSSAKGDKSSWKVYVEGIIKSRMEEKKQKESIFWNNLSNYARYGAKNPSTFILSEKELRTATPEQALAKVRSILTHQHRIMYYGPRSTESVAAILNTHHITPEQLIKTTEIFPFVPQRPEKPFVYFVHYDDMQQADVAFLAFASTDFGNNKEILPPLRMYNEYFGGSMGSIVFQELRESKALAYSTFAGYSSPSRPDRPASMTAYIGTQSDKLAESLSSMKDLLLHLPRSEKAWSITLQSMKNSLESKRTVREGVLLSYDGMRKFGYTYDPSADVYASLNSLTFADIEAFQANNIKPLVYSLCVMGDRKRIDMNVLKQYGEVKELTLQQLFGY